MKKKKNPVTMINDILFSIEKEVTWVLFLAMLILLVIQVVCRYVLNMPLAWSEEICRLLYIAVSFIGAAIATRERSHISINILPAIVNGITHHDEKKTNRMLMGCDVIMSVICIVFWGWLTVILTNYTITVKNLNTLTPAIQFPQYIVYVACVVSGALIVIHYLLNMIEMFINKESMKPVEDADLAEAADGKEAAH